jgi:phosphotransacetylase
VEPLGEIDVAFHRYNAFARLFERCRGMPPVVTAVVHPCDRESLLGAMEAAARGVIVPVLVGPEASIRAVATRHGVDLAGVRLVGTEHSHEAAARAVAMARAGEVEALMKGALHTDELMSAVVSSTSGLRTGRRVSHVFVMDVADAVRPEHLDELSHHALRIERSLHLADQSDRGAHGPWPGPGGRWRA